MNSFPIKNSIWQIKPWGDEYVDHIKWRSIPEISFRHRVSPSHLTDNMEWREESDGYQCSSHAHLTFITTATELIFDTLDYAHYGQMVTPVILQNDNILLQLPALPEDVKEQMVPLSLQAGEKRITIINSLQSNCSWGGVPKNHIIRSIYSNAPLNYLRPDENRKTDMVIYGDSIAAGGNADIPGVQAWGTLLRQHYNIAFEASGWKRLQDDAGKLPAVAKRVASCHPAIAWLAIGVNDFQGPDPMNIESFTKTYMKFIELIHEYSPDTIIIAQSPIVMAAANNVNNVGAVLTDYRGAIKKAAQHHEWCNYVDGSTILKLSDLADGVHPGTNGMAKYADWVRNYLLRTKL